MKSVEAWSVAEEHVLPVVGDEAVVVRRLVVLRPVEFVLRSLVFEPSSSFATDFHLHALADPLYAPHEQPAGTPRVRSPRFVYDGGLTRAEAEELRRWLEADGLPLLARIRTPGDVAEEIERRERGFPPDPLKEETRGYSLILAGREDEARAALRHVIELYDDGSEILDYEHDAIDRAEAMLERLDEGRAAATKVLNDRRRQNAARIGVSDLLERVPQ